MGSTTAMYRTVLLLSPNKLLIAGAPYQSFTVRGAVVALCYSSGTSDTLHRWQRYGKGGRVSWIKKKNVKNFDSEEARRWRGGTVWGEDVGEIFGIDGERGL